MANLDALASRYGIRPTKSLLDDLAVKSGITPTAPTGLLEGIGRSLASGIGDIEKNIGGQMLRAANADRENELELLGKFGINDMPTEPTTQEQIGNWLRSRGESVIKANEPALSAIPEDNTGQRFINDLARSLPSSFAIMPPALLAGRTAGTVANTVGNYALKNSSKAKNLWDAIGNWTVKGKNVGQGAQRMISAAPEIGAGAGASVYLESHMEAQDAYDSYIENAKRDGSYIKGYSEKIAEQIANGVYEANRNALAGLNALEYATLFGTKGKIPKWGGFKKEAKRLGGTMLNEAVQEDYQQVVQDLETRMRGDASFSDYLNPSLYTSDEALYAAALGAASGGLFHSANRGVELFSNRLNPTPQKNGGDGDDRDIITANNFDTNLFDKWESQAGATDLDNVLPEVKGALNNLARELGNGGKIIITGGAEKGYHAEGEFGHEGGWKIDIDKNSINDPQKFFDLCEKYGFAVGDEGDHYDLSAHKQGGVGGTVKATPSTFLSDILGGGQGTSSNGTMTKEEQIAAAISKNTGIPADWIWAQMYHETGGFSSELAKLHNYGGVKGAGNRQTDSRGHSYFDSDEDYINYMSNYYKKYAEDGLLDAKTPEEFVHALKKGGYFTDDESNYLNGVKSALARRNGAPISDTNTNTNINTNNNNVDTSFLDETVQDNSRQQQALLEALNNVDVAGLSREQRLALLDMVAMRKNELATINPNAPELSAYDILINNENYDAIKNIFPQDFAQIVGMNNEASVDQMREAIHNYIDEGANNGKFDDPNEIGRLRSIADSGNKQYIKDLYNQLGLSASSVPTPKLDEAKKGQGQQQTSFNLKNFNNIFGTNISAERFKQERDNIRDMHHKQMLQEEASAGKLPSLKRKVNTDLLQAANNMGTNGGIQGKKGFERGIIGSTLEKALNSNDPNLKQAAENIIRQIQQEDEAAYFNGNVSVMQGVGQSRKPVLVRTQNDGLTQDAIQRYNSPDWSTFAQREGYQATGENAPHTLRQEQTPQVENQITEADVNNAISGLGINEQATPTGQSLTQPQTGTGGVAQQQKSTNQNLKSAAEIVAGYTDGSLSKEEAINFLNQTYRDSPKASEKRHAESYKKIYDNVLAKLESIEQKQATSIVENLKEKFNKEIEKFSNAIKNAKNKEASRDKCLKKLNKIYQTAISKTKIKNETKTAMKEVYDNAVNEVNRIYYEATSQNNETTSQRETSEVASDIANSTDETSQSTDETSQNEAQAKSTQNNDVASEATNGETQTKKAADEGEQENEVEVSNSSSNETVNEDVETVKKSLVDLAEDVWKGSSSHNRVSFKPSKKLKDKAKELFGHDIDEVFITSDDVRHIKKHHSEYEEKRGQKSLTPKDFANIYDAVNDFESATLEESDKQGNKKMLVVLNRDGKQYALLIERGKNKAEIKTAYKKLTRMSDVTSPEPNVRNDSKSTIVDSTIPQTEATSKDKNETKQDTKQQERTQSEDAFSNGKKTNEENTKGLPRLKGSKKQIAWAEEIRDRVLDITRNTPAKGEKGEKIKDLTLQWLEAQTDSSFWIEHLKGIKSNDNFRTIQVLIGYYMKNGYYERTDIWQRINDLKLNQDTRGVYDAANNIVTLTENADESTFIHEMGHHYYNVLKQAAKIAGKNSQAKKDLDTIDNWTNYKEGMAAEYEDTASEKEFADLEKEIIKAEEKGDTKKVEELKARWKQERWARGVEEYLSEGIAPTAKLRKIFNDFKKWLKEIYRGLKGAGAKPSDDVRAVMERMIASDKEILTGKATRLSGDTKAAYDKALADLKAAGVKNAEANAYLAAKMAERLSSAYKEAGENKTAVELLPKIQAQDKSAKNQKEAVRKKYEGTKEWLKAPNGEDTNLTEDQWLTVRTPSFKKWFGDWENDPKNASKVVDENGEPLVVYHWTGKKDFTIFQSGNSAGIIYFANDKDKAKKAARQKAKVMECFLSVKSPLGENKPIEWYDAEDSNNVRKWERAGYDGVYVSDEAEISIAVFKPNQIKSATDNNGEFNENDPSILHQKSAKSPIENKGETKDNEGNKEEQEFRERILKGKIKPLNPEARNNGITHSVVNEFNKQIAKLEREGWTEQQIQDLLERENSFLLKEVVKPWAEVANKFHTEHTGKKGVVCEILRDEKVCDHVGYKAIDEVYDTFKKRAEEMIDDAKLVFAECAYTRRSGRNPDELRSWRELEQSIARHGGTAQFKVRPNENPNQQQNTQQQKHSNPSAFSITEKPSKVNGKESTFFSVNSDLMDVSGHIPQGGIPFIDNLWYNEKYASDPTDVSTISPNVLRKGNATKHILSVINYLKDKGHNTFQVKTMSEYSNALMKSLERKGYIKAKSAWKYEGDNVTYDILNISEEKHFNQGAFSIDEKGGKFTAKLKTMSNEQTEELVKDNVSLKNIADNYNGEMNGNTFTFDNEADRANFMQVAEAFLSTVDGDTKVKGSIDAWHGNGLYELIDKFSLKYLGTGEGAQVHGWGLYFTKSREIGEEYRDILSEDNQSGHLYHVQIPNEDVMLDEQKTFEKQSKKVQKALKEIEKTEGEFEGLSGKKIYDKICDRFQKGLLGKGKGRAVNAPQKASELLNKHGIKGITYDGRTDGRCYVVFDNNAIDIIEKFSAEKLPENSIAKLAAKAEIIANEDLTAEEKRFVEMGEKLGTLVVWINADPRLNGWHKDGVTFINRNRRMTGEKTFWHESLHFILQNEDGLLSELADAVNISDKQIEKWKDKTGRYELSREEVIEEMLCDEFHDPASRVKIFQEIARKNPTLMEKIMTWINRLKEQFFDAFRGTQGRLTQSQKDNMTRVIDNHFKNLKGKDGKPLFKRKEKEWTLANGESLENRIAASGQGKKSSKSPIENSDNLRDNQNDIAPQIKYKPKEIIPSHLEVSEYGSLLVTPFKARPNHETNQERETRRKEEIKEIGNRLDSQNKDTTAFIELLSDEQIKGFDSLAKKGSWAELQHKCEAKYNSALTHYASLVYEGDMIARLCVLKGAIQYARSKGTYTRRNENFVRYNADTRGNLGNTGQNGSQQNRITSTKHSASIAGASFSASVEEDASESLSQKIKNIFTSDGSEKARYRQQMAKSLESALGVKIRYGKMDAKDGEIVYKEEDKVIRSKHPYDWGNILPVASGVLAKKLGVPDTEEHRNLISNWFLEGTLDKNSAAWKNLETKLNDPANLVTKTRLIDAQNTFQMWRDKEADERMEKCVQDYKKQTKTAKEWLQYAYNEMVEEFAPIERMVERYEKDTGKELNFNINPDVALRLYRGTPERVMVMVNGDTKLAVEALKIRYPGVDWTGFKTLKDILGSIDAFQDKEKQRKFRTYCVACQMLEMHDKNDALKSEIATLEDDIESLKEQIDSTQDANYKKSLKAELKEAENNLAKLNKQEPFTIPKEYSRQDCERYINNGRAKYGKAQRDLVRYSEVLLNILYDSGVKSSEEYHEMLGTWKNYVPLHRVFDENEDIQFGDSLLKREGSERDIVDPLASIIHNTANFIQRAERNKAIRVLSDFSRVDGTGWLVEEVSNNDPDTKTTVSYFENGKKKFLEVSDPTIAKAINKMDLSSSGLVTKICHAVTKTARACFTTLNPAFILSNIARDMQDAFLFDGVMPWDTVRGFLHAFNRDEIYYEWATSGAAQGSFMSVDRDYTEEAIKNMGKNLKKQLLSTDFFNTIIEGVQKASELSEQANRIAVYKKRKGKYLKEKMDANNAMLGAALRSRDLIDFGRHGKTGKKVNQYVAFFNAFVQGADKFYREVVDFHGWKKDAEKHKGFPKEHAKTLGRLAFAAIVPAFFLSLLYDDDDDYENLDEWVKNVNWTIKAGDTWVKIPKGADIGIHFISNCVRKMMDNKKHSLGEYGELLRHELPSYMPNIIAPYDEAEDNYSKFLKRNIVPHYQLENEAPKNQYGANTTTFAKWLGEKLNYSPRKIEHLIQGYTGSLGMAPLRIIDVLSGKQQLSTDISGMPLFTRFMQPTYKSGQHVQDFYDKLKEQTQLDNEYKKTKVRPEGYNPAMLKRMKAANKRLSELNKKENEAIINPKLSYDQRKEIVSRIQKERSALTKKALSK